MIYVYSELQSGINWLRKYSGKQPGFVCILGFTATGLIPGISAAGATPTDREYTAIADAEFLVRGILHEYQNPLPILSQGVSPAFISRAVIEALAIPPIIINAGVLHQPTVDSINLDGVPAACVTSGQALPLDKVHQLFSQGQEWGEKLARSNEYLVVGECVVGGTTTALALLTALGIEAQGMVNSSHPSCNHAQKWSIVEQGLSQAKRLGNYSISELNPFEAVAAIGDPMQIVAAGMALAASRQVGVILAGGTQMLAVYALIKAIARSQGVAADLSQITVGTTRWVAEDPTGNTVKLAKLIGGVSLLATGLNFSTSRYPNFRAFNQGYVKEGVGAGGCAITAHLTQDWTSVQLLIAVENLFCRYRHSVINQE